MNFPKKTFSGYKIVNGEAVAQYVQEGFCTSSENKPTTAEFANGSSVIEMDTGKLYFYDENASTWREF